MSYPSKYQSVDCVPASNLYKLLERCATALENQVKNPIQTVDFNTENIGGKCNIHMWLHTISSGKTSEVTYQFTLEKRTDSTTIGEVGDQHLLTEYRVLTSTQASIELVVYTQSAVANYIYPHMENLPRPGAAYYYEGYTATIIDVTY